MSRRDFRAPLTLARVLELADESRRCPDIDRQREIVAALVDHIDVTSSGTG